MKLANKAWKEGVDGNSFVVFPDDVSFHDARHLLGPVFVHEPITTWLLEPFENGKDPALNTCAMGFAIYEYLHAHGGTILGMRGSNGTLEAAAVLRVKNLGTRSSCGCWNTLKASMIFTRALLSIYWNTPGGIARELYHAQFKRDRHVFDRRLDLMRNGFAYGQNKVGLEGNYWYVAFVGVHSESQGKGIGRELMRRLGYVADQQEMTCYLETSGDQNIRFYQSLGFKIECDIELSDDQLASHLSVVAMVRRPLPKDQAAV